MEKNRVSIKKVIFIGCLVSAAILVGILGSYAYFISVGNNNQNQSANIQTGNMALTFSDGNNGINQSLNFGESITKIFTIENTGSLETKAKINWLNLVNTYLKESLTYTLSYSETEDGEYSEIVTNKNVPRSEIASTKTLVNNLTIPVGAKYYYKLIITLNYLEEVDQTADLNAILSTEFILEEGYEQGIIPLMVNAIINEEELPENAVKEGNPNFAESATTDETRDGLYAMEDDYGTSYYFRGAVENNYVKFGDFYWRIIRINGDGSLRIIYDGTSAHINGEINEDKLAIKNVAWNTESNDAKYVGYMFGGLNESASTSKEQAQTNETDSEIKTYLENWYKTNIREKGLDKYVSDEIFCNDRTTPGKSYTGLSSDTSLGYGTNVTAYGATARSNVWNTTLSKVQPKFTCSNKNDAFTKDDTNNGNGTLNEKVGLITSDEILAAGSGKYRTAKTNYYLTKGSWYWALSSYCYNNGNTRMFAVDSTGFLSSAYVNNETGSIVPVINLNPDYVINLIGDGTIGNEYRSK